MPQDIRAPDLATLDLYCDRVASAVGRLSVRVFGLPEDDGILLAHHLGRALQLTNILRDIDEDAGHRPALSAARRPAARRHHHDDPQKVIADPALPKVCAPLVERARTHFEKADEIMNRNPRRVVRAPRIMSKYYRAILELLVAQGFRRPARAGSRQQDGPHRHPSSLRVHLMQKTVHIIGAGISGLSAAVRLANAELPGACPRGDAAGRRPLPVLFRRRHQPHHRQRQSSAAVRQPPRARLCAIDRHRGGAGRAEARAISLRRSRRPASAGSSISATAGCRCGCSTRRAASPIPACSIISH